jgi:hypothetical protein
MKTIIAGSRSLEPKRREIWSILETTEGITEVVSGLAKGPDLIGKWWGLSRRLPVAEFPADWATLGKRAGFTRNLQMADYAEQLLAFWDGKSRGTEHMINSFRSKYPEKPIHIFTITP